jgi:hypothetical protein
VLDTSNASALRKLGFVSGRAVDGRENVGEPWDTTTTSHSPPTSMANDLSWMPGFARWIMEKEAKGELSGERTRDVDEGFIYLRSLLKDAVTGT